VFVCQAVDWFREGIYTDIAPVAMPLVLLSEFRGGWCLYVRRWIGFGRVYIPI